MCSIITHSLVGLAVARVGTARRMPPRYWVAAALLAAAPDLDAAAYALGLGHLGEAMWSHRGLSHSIPFALVVAGVVAFGAFAGPGMPGRPLRPACAIDRWRVWLILAAAMMSHGLTDMLTNGGAGVALLLPFSQWRSKWAFHPVEVSPLSVTRFFSTRGLEILWSELRWVLLPAAMVVAAVEITRRRVMNVASPRM